MTKGGSYEMWAQGTRDRQSATPNYSNGQKKDLERSVSRTEQEEEPERGQWDNKAEFILSCVGMSVGLGNVWRFPYLAYENGGAAFLIAYLVLQLLIGKPMYFMELVMGQFSGKGPTKVWEMNPAAKGIGISMCIISLIVAIYYNIIMAYTLLYFFSSMQENLPWTECTQDWIDNHNCVSQTTIVPAACVMMNQTDPCACTNDTSINTLNCTLANTTYTTSAELFFNLEVQAKSAGVAPDQMGSPLWKLSLCLLLSWVIVVICLIKGIKSSGKVVYFTATFPYVVLLILLVRGALLDGAIDGVEFFIIPKWDKLTDIDVWVAAAGQMFFSLSVSFGGIIMFGSYNKFKNQVYYDSLFISVMDLVTSIIAGFVVFTTFGGMAKSVGTTVDKVASGGYGLAFIVYPEALSNLPLPQLWSVLFFFMLFTLGLDSEFGLMETIMTCIQDEFPKMRKYKSYLAVGLGVMCFFMALPCTCPGGDYVVTIMDHYGADFSVLFISFFEVISVMWVYGAMRFLKDIEYMLGAKPHGWPYWIFCWTITAPLIIASLFMYRMINYTPPSYADKTPFPGFAQAIGWVILGIALCPVPINFLWRFYKSFHDPDVRDATDRRRFLFSPTDEWRPNDGLDRYLDDDAPCHTPYNDVPMTTKGNDNLGYSVHRY